MAYYVFIIIALLSPMLVWIHYIRANILDKRAEADLMSSLFPEGNEQCEKVINEMRKLTHNRFNRAQLLDYYLKIKGLQFIDLHTSSNRYVSDYLMRPTKIKLNYQELVQFYERYLNLPQSTGIDATTDFD
ncbi:MAG: hypothetical protein MJZ27_00635 [Bacteroidales bacterium]|nr:hypothetical protein [Bacteroidales bacterium]